MFCHRQVVLNLARGFVLVSSLSLAAVAGAEEKFVFLTNWFAQAEHGGYYQALAEGRYKKEGLNVEIRQGGGRINGMQLLAAGEGDCYMGHDVLTMKAHEQGMDVVTIAAIFQKDPLALAAHPEVERIEDLKGKPITLGTNAYSSYWPWLRKKFGFDDSQTQPYTDTYTTFIVDKNRALQAYATYTPYALETKAGIKPKMFLLSDYGWPPYSTTIVCMRKTLHDRPKAVAAFLKASLEGWKSYLAGDPAPGNALIKRDNPAMTDGQLAYSIAAIKQGGYVSGGDAAEHGIGTITDARMKQTYDLLVSLQLLDPEKVKVADTYTTEVIRQTVVQP